MTLSFYILTPLALVLEVAYMFIEMGKSYLLVSSQDSSEEPRKTTA